jgi:hypothetical protein
MKREGTIALASMLAGAIAVPTLAASPSWEIPGAYVPLRTLALGTIAPPAETGAPGHELPAAEAAAGEKWWFAIDFSLWLPGISGDVGVAGVTTHVDSSFVDILDDTDSVIGLAGEFAFGRGKLGGYVNGFWSKMGQEVADPAGTIDITSDMAIVGFGVSYEAGRWPMEFTARDGQPARDLTLTAYAGGRYSAVSLDIDHPVLPDRDRSKDWVDPILGGGVLFPFAQEWSMMARGEVGGFGAASDFAWAAALLFSWDFHIKELPSSLQFGYMAVGDDYSTGSGPTQFEWDTILHGLVLNFEIRF